MRRPYISEDLTFESLRRQVVQYVFVTTGTLFEKNTRCFLK